MKTKLEKMQELLHLMPTKKNEAIMLKNTGQLPQAIDSLQKAMDSYIDCAGTLPSRKASDYEELKALIDNPLRGFYNAIKDLQVRFKQEYKEKNARLESQIQRDHENEDQEMLSDEQEDSFDDEVGSLFDAKKSLSNENPEAPFKEEPDQVPQAEVKGLQKIEIITRKNSDAKDPLSNENPEAPFKEEPDQVPQAEVKGLQKIEIITRKKSDAKDLLSNENPEDNFKEEPYQVLQTEVKRAQKIEIIKIKTSQAIDDFEQVVEEMKKQAKSSFRSKPTLERILTEWQATSELLKTAIELYLDDPFDILAQNDLNNRLNTLLKDASEGSSAKEIKLLNAFFNCLKSICNACISIFTSNPDRFYKTETSAIQELKKIRSTLEIGCLDTEENVEEVAELPSVSRF